MLVNPSSINCFCTITANDNKNATTCYLQCLNIIWHAKAKDQQQQKRINSKTV